MLLVFIMLFYSILQSCILNILSSRICYILGLFTFKSELVWASLHRVGVWQSFQLKQHTTWRTFALLLVRDIFLFCCYTSLRYSDVYNLCHSNIKGSYIEIVTVKTDDRIIIEFNDKSKAIYDKYKDFHFEGKKVFPVISNQKMNDYLKDLAELAGLNNPVRQTYYKGSERIETVLPKYAVLSTHDARRTFICNALSLGIPANVVMKWTGHSDYKAMKPYIDIADDIKASAMSKFNQL